LVSVEYQRINYSDAGSVGNPSARVGGCMMGDASMCLGGSAGAGFGWRDIDVFKLGAQWRASPSLVLRAGYNLSGNPIRPEDVTFHILGPGVVRHHVTAGATWALAPGSAVTVAAMYAFSNDVEGASLFNHFAPGMELREKIEMYQYSIGVQYARRF